MLILFMCRSLYRYVIKVETHNAINPKLCTRYIQHKIAAIDNISTRRLSTSVFTVLGPKRFQKDDRAMSDTRSTEAPRRGIYNDLDMKQFIESSTRKELVSFVEAMGKSVVMGARQAGQDPAFDPLNPLNGLPPSMACLHGALRQMITWVDDFPPTNPELARFGNPAFRQWHARLLSRSDAIVTAILKSRDAGLSNEEASQRGWDAAAGVASAVEDDAILHVSCYLHDAFGHATRLDYGTGHESSFLVFLLVLSKVKCLGPDVPPQISTLRSVTLSMVDQYLKVTRRLQTEYRLEPAGSHGVWGLDDYHCLPFYFGACQLQALSESTTPGLDSLTHPSVVNQPDMLREVGDKFLYLGCIRYIRELKQGVPFFESSPMLYDISQTMNTWDKVARGMLRLYQGEVMDKRQVVQHFVFSKLFPMTWTPSQLTERQAPVETFRVEPSMAGLGSMPVTRAPWARPPGETPPPGMSPTRAPWVDNEGADDNPMAPTRAPWAK